MFVHAALAQPSPRFEAGVQLGAIDMRAGLGEKPLNAGDRVTVNAWRFLDVEGEVNRFPIGGAASNYPATEALFGARAGVRAWPFGIFAKVRDLTRCCITRTWERGRLWFWW